MAAVTQPTIVVIVGVSGDLSRRKLLPALEQMAAAGVLPSQYKIIGVSRQKLQLKDILPSKATHLKKHLALFQMDLTNPADYKKLSAHLDDVATTFGSKQPVQRLFYISVPPQVSQPVVQFLGEANFNTKHDKLLLEKPFGTDLTSAQELVEAIKHHYTEDQIYRIDHYLAKEMAQNLVIFRAGNALFNNTWNNQFIQSINIVASEKIGIEGRAAFYEQTGAMRDVLQSHLLQLAALVLMELPKADDWQAVPALRLKALQALKPLTNERVTRAQYEGYQTDAKNPGSRIETFVSALVTSDDPRWEGVPITTTTGKALAAKTTEIHIVYKAQHADHANRLVLRIQPREGAEIDVQSKVPGYDRDVQTVKLSFAYGDTSNLLDAYEQVFLSAMNSDHSLFTTSDEVIASWQVVQPVLTAWSFDNAPLPQYPKGSTPEEVVA